MNEDTTILQFGTGRFLLAHVDLFVSQALERGEALGRITMVQTTASPASAGRTAALALGSADADGYPVRLRGLRAGTPVDETLRSRSIAAAVHAQAQWPWLRHHAAAGPLQVIVSNTGDLGWQLDDSDGPAALDEVAPAPRSFPAKLLVLLQGRWREAPQRGLSVLPCELVSRNGDMLHQLIVSLATQWQQPRAFVDWLGTQVRWGNSLVDRIVSEAIEPVGAVAEPYALWAIERQPGLVLPCRHDSIVLTDRLAGYERLKLYLLNLGHTVLAEQWLARPKGPVQTVLQAMQDTTMRAQLEAVWADEVLPVFDALGERAEAEAYLVVLRERLRNPFLAHRLADIAQHHAQKKQRRIAPLVALAQAHRPGLAQARLRAALGSAAAVEGVA